MRHFLRPSSNLCPSLSACFLFFFQRSPGRLDDAPGEVQVPARTEPKLRGRLSCKVYRRAFEWRQEPGAWVSGHKTGEVVVLRNYFCLSLIVFFFVK